MMELDSGSRYLGEFAIGTNQDITRFTGNILFDEKIGGSFHMALGAGYPETGSKNKSAIHWDMICDLRKDLEIQLMANPFIKMVSLSSKNRWKDYWLIYITNAKVSKRYIFILNKLSKTPQNYQPSVHIHQSRPQR